jgi:hypothetical protein
VAHHHCSDGYGDPELHTFKFIDSEVSPLDTNLKEEALALKELEIQMELLKVEASAAAALWCREREVTHYFGFSGQQSISLFIGLFFEKLTCLCPVRKNYMWLHLTLVTFF